MLTYDYRRRLTPFTTPRLRDNYILVSSWELIEFGDIRENFSSLGIVQDMGGVKYNYSPLCNLKRNTRDLLTDFTYNLVE